MELYYSNTSGLDPQKAARPAQSGQKGSAFGASLLARGLEISLGLPIPGIERRENGKPWFPELPDVHFSVSHSGEHVLCAISSHPVGADVQRHKPLRPGLFEAIAGQEERESFAFYELWTLRESYYKLTGEGSLRSIPFRRSGDKIMSPREDVFCRVYHEIEGATAAVCSLREKPSSAVTVIPGSELVV